jgi:hypothetical protein
MKTMRPRNGPFAERPFFSAQEVERICEDELRKSGLYPDSPQSIRIERFVEKRFQVRPIYEDLPTGVLGYTEFGPSGVVAVYVSRALAEEGTKVAERRLNTTFAHEAGHGLLHTHLFVLEPTHVPHLFGDGVDRVTPRILCRDGDVGHRESRSDRPKGYDGRWWEVQANMVIGALLLPRALVVRALDPFLESTGKLGTKTLNGSRMSQAVKSLADVFDVNPVVAQIRVTEIFGARDERQLAL